MQVVISGKKIIGVAGALCLALLGWFGADYLGMRDRVTRLETASNADARQDAELAELRATILDIVMLTKTELGSPGVALGPLPPGGPSESNPDVAEETLPTIPDDAAYREFRVEQVDLETMLRNRGLEPSMKERLPIRRREDQ